MEERSDGSVEAVRGRFQGVRNIVEFNYPYYALVLILLAAAITLQGIAPTYVLYSVVLLCSLVFASLVTSYYVYDRSQLYDLSWLESYVEHGNARIVNVHAGYDETSAIIHRLFPGSRLTVLDFYDPEKHTEPSIQRARKKYPPYPNTDRVRSTSLGLSKASVDLVILFLAAHEIREREERIQFFRELKRSLNTDGKIILTEHLRDLPNLLAYTIGAFHFFSRREWLTTVCNVGLSVQSEWKMNPFIRTFILTKHGDAY